MVSVQSDTKDTGLNRQEVEGAEQFEVYSVQQWVG